jgi:hypothetical protein
LHKLLGDRQSEPRAAVFSGRGDIGLAERFEQMLLRFSPGHGSNFSFSLPVQMQADPRPIDSADHVLTGARVLIADAHPTTGRFLQSQLAGSLLSKKRSKKELTKRPPFLVKSLVWKSSEKTVNGGWRDGRTLEPF